MADPAGVAKNMNASNISQSSQALVIQAYSLSVNEQQNVDFSTDPNLAKYQTKINTSLGTAQGHANYYLNTLQPMIINNISNISNYYQLNNAVPATLPANSTEAQWLQVLGTLQAQAAQYKTYSDSIIASLTTFSSALARDAGNFDSIVTELNSAMNGDNGVLATLKDSLAKAQTNIGGASAGIAAGALGMIGGGIMIGVGAFADVVTGGAATGVVVGGIALEVAGIGTEAGSIALLVTSLKEKSSLLQEQAQLTAEVTVALGISSGYTSLSDGVKNSITAAQQMSDAWLSLGDDLTNMQKDLTNGISSTGDLQTLWLNAANGEVATLLTDIANIKTQMAGVQVQNAAPQQNIADLATAMSQQAA